MKKFVKGKKWKGSLPHLVKKGSVIINLENSNPDLKLYAIDFSGKRGREIPTEYKDSAYMFQAQTVTPGAAATMMYELNGE